MTSCRRNTVFDIPLGVKVKDKIDLHGEVVDIGAGIRPISKGFLCVEPHKEYADILSNNGYEVVNKTAIEFLKDSDSVDTILLLDVIEHMDKLDGQEVIHLSMKLANQVVVFTPLGFMPQDGEGKDPWGLNGWKWQKHRSGWMPSDFPNWDTYVDTRTHRGQGAFFAIFNRDAVLGEAGAA